MVENGNLKGDIFELTGRYNHLFMIHENMKKEFNIDTKSESGDNIMETNTSEGNSGSFQTREKAGPKSKKNKIM